MPRVVSIRLRRKGQFYDFDAGEMELKPGDWVIVETVRGQDIGQIVLPPAEVAAELIENELKPVVRLADEADLNSMERFREKEEEALERARVKVLEDGLPMRLVSAEYTYNGRSLTIYFTSEKRVDFRELVKHLAREFRTRIELRQVGARDEACMLGGIGSCGRPLCCATFLHDFLRISVRMAKEQDLPLSPMKISGVCGRLLCCLSYEYEQYREIKANLPVVGEEVTTARGSGHVVAVSVPKEMATVELRPGVTIDVKAQELSRTCACGAGRPAYVPAELTLEDDLPEEIVVTAEAPATQASPEEGEKKHRKRHRRKKKSDNGAAAGAEAAPEPARERLEDTRAVRPRPESARPQQRPPERRRDRPRGAPRGPERPAPERPNGAQPDRARPNGGQSPAQPAGARPNGGQPPAPQSGDHRRRRPRRRLPARAEAPEGRQP